MRIAVNVTAAFNPRRTGVEEYVWQLYKNLPSIAEACGHELLFYKGEHRFWNQLSLPRLLRQDRPDAYFTPAQPPPLQTHGVRTVSVVHGVEWRVHPKGYSPLRRLIFDAATRTTLARSQKIIVPSNITKEGLMRFFDCPESQICVIPHGSPEVGNRQEAIGNRKQETGNRQGPLVLFVGRKDKRKNIDGIVRAFRRFAEAGNSCARLALVGPRGNASRIQCSGNIIVEDNFVSQEEKTRWYSQADVFFFPSFAEGFGIPILEAQARGVPVITSRSFEEIAGEGAAYVDPQSIGDMAGMLTNVLSDAEHRRVLVENGYKNLQRFSWQKCAEETLAQLVNL